MIYKSELPGNVVVSQTYRIQILYNYVRLVHWILSITPFRHYPHHVSLVHLSLKADIVLRAAGSPDETS